LTHLIVCCISRSQSGNVNVFKTLGRDTGICVGTLLICADLHMDSLTESIAKQKLETIMKTFNLTGVINFPMRI
jgi:hypothetical protein